MRTMNLHMLNWTLGACILLTSCVFFFPFLCDTLGDTTGAKHSYIPGTILVLLGLMIVNIYRVRFKKQREVKKNISLERATIDTMRHSMQITSTYNDSTPSLEFITNPIVNKSSSYY